MGVGYAAEDFRPLHIVVIRSDCCASPTHISRLSPPLANSNIAVGDFSWHRVHLKGRRQCVVPLWKVRGPQCWQRCVEGDALGHARVCRCRGVSGQRSWVACVVSGCGALNVNAERSGQARVNGGSNYDSLKVAKCLVF